MVPKSNTNQNASTRLAPKEGQVSDILRQRIRIGEYRAGQWLPTERTLTVELGVHRRVVRAAVQRLTQEGWLLQQPRCRPVVAPKPPYAEQSQPTVSSEAPRLVALVMWHGGFEQGATAQQRIFWGMTQELAAAGYHAVFLDPGGEIGSEEQNGLREARQLRYAAEHNFAGIVFYPYAYRSNRVLLQELARSLPLVLIDRMMPGLQTDFVGLNNYQAMDEAAQYLLALGHRRIAYATVVEPINSVHDRLEGYRHAMSRAGLSPQVLMAEATNEWPTLEAIFHQSPEERPTALLCLSDYVASRVAERLTAMGLSIPDDIALVGFDNIIQMLPGGVGLTTMAQPFEQIGIAAVKALLNRIADLTLPVQHCELAARMVIRASSGAVRSEIFLVPR